MVQMLYDVRSPITAIYAATSLVDELTERIEFSDTEKRFLEKLIMYGKLLSIVSRIVEPFECAFEYFSVSRDERD